MAQENIQTKAGRARLEIRAAPYFAKLSEGCFLGFRRGPETWVARCRVGTKQHHRPLGALAEWDDAKRMAEDWFKQMGGCATEKPTRGTVREALAAYIADLRRKGRVEAGDRAEKLFTRALKLDAPSPDPLADMELERVRLEHFEALQDRLAQSRGRGRAYPPEQIQQILQRLRDGAAIKTLARESGIDPGTLRRWKANDGKAKETGRAPQSVNRITRQIKAALDVATARKGYVGNAAAWQKLEGLTTGKKGDDEGRVRLSPEQRARLIAHASDSAARFLRGLWWANGPRPGELADATVRDFDPREGTIRFQDIKGDGTTVRTRLSPLSTEAIEFFKQCAKGKLPGAPLVHDRSPDEHFKPNRWASGINAAMASANAARDPTDSLYIPDMKPHKASAYSIRHSFISEALQIYQLDPITVCKITGTSLEMLHKHYWHLISERVRSVLDSIKTVAA